MTTSTVESPTSASSAKTGKAMFHLSLNVANLDAAVAFYQVLTGRPPAKCYPDYAKFETEDPPVVLSLEPQPHAAGGALNHLGYRVASSEAIVEIQRRLEAAGIACQREEGVECCYARQTKFWVRDPDRNLWEVYVLEADTAHRGMGSQASHDPHDSTAHTSNPEPKPEATETPASDQAWEHQLGQPLPAAIPAKDSSLDRIYLRGTFNAPTTPAQRESFLKEARRALRPGGKLVIHGLGADSDIGPGNLSLPGPAAGVSAVPVTAELIESVKSAPFHGVKLAKLSASPVFRHNGVALREVLLEAVKLDRTPFDLRQTVLYMGPLAELRDDFGNAFKRGQRVSIPTPAAEAIRLSAIGESFVFFPPGADQ